MFLTLFLKLQYVCIFLIVGFKLFQISIPIILKIYFNVFDLTHFCVIYQHF